jgi:hypothetical protein
LSDGIYRVSYGVDATGTTGIASIALANNGSTIPQSISNTTLTAETDVARLSSTIIVDAQAMPITLSLVNSGTTTTTYNNTTLNASEII